MTTIAELHATYVRETGISLALSADRMAAWQRWQARGWDVAQLVGVLRSIDKGVRAKPQPLRNPGALRFSVLIADPEKFEEELGLARAEYRRRNVRKPKVYAPGKASVLRATGRPDEPPQQEAKAVKDVDWAKIAAEMRKAANGERTDNVGGE